MKENIKFFKHIYDVSLTPTPIIKEMSKQAICKFALFHQHRHDREREKEIYCLSGETEKNKVRKKNRKRN